jgi:hypothetical protein
VRERSFVDKKTPVPFCNDGDSMCVWAYEDFTKYGTSQFPQSPGMWGPGGRDQGVARGRGAPQRRENRSRPNRTQRGLPHLRQLQLSREQRFADPAAMRAPNSFAL